MRVPPEYVYDSLDMHYLGTRINDIRLVLERKYSYSPSRTVIHKWIHKFTARAIGYFNLYSPSVGDIWIVGETIRELAGKRFKIYDVVDIKTGYLLTTHVSLTRSGTMMKKVMEEAVKIAQKRPGIIVAFMNYSYFYRIKNMFDCQVEHISLQPQEIKYNKDSIELISTLYEQRERVTKGIKSTQTTDWIIDGWKTYYNYFQRQSKLDDRTPAESAEIVYQIKNWKDFVIHDSQQMQ